MSGHAYTAQALRPRAATQRRAPGERRSATTPLLLAGGCLLALVLTWAVITHVPAARLKDAIALHDFTLLNRPALEAVGNVLLHLLEPTLFLLWGAAIVAIALARGRPRLALAAASVMALAPLTSETLKPLLAHRHDHVAHVHVGPASWPSGHSTAALALVLSALLVTPARLRPLVALLGAVFTAAVGVALLVLAWHMPSDVLGGYLVAGLFTALAVACLRLAERRWPAKR